MAESVKLIDPQLIKPNKENPRLIFREDELNALQESIKEQGILVPLTVFADGRHFTILDGERRWRCSLKLGLVQVPVIIQPKPDRLRNIMMMFAIHKARSDWDPLPTAMKLQQLEEVLTLRHGHKPSEHELAAAASLTRGEVRRFRKILSLPEYFKNDLMRELDKPRTEQSLTVDHVLESVKGAESLRKKLIINKREETALSKALVRKFRARTLKSTVAPRQLPKIARAVERNEISVASAKKAVQRLISDDHYTIDDAFRDSAAQVDFEHSIEQLISRLNAKLEEHVDSEFEPGPKLVLGLRELASTIRRFLR